MVCTECVRLKGTTGFCLVATPPACLCLGLSYDTLRHYEGKDGRFQLHIFIIVVRLYLMH